jgi:hypothetical protein
VSAREFNALITPRVDRLISLGREIIVAVAGQRGTGPQAGFAFDAADIKVVCDTVSLRDDAPGWDGTWSTVLRHLGNRAASIPAALRPFYSRLTPDLLEALEQEELAMDEVLLMERFGRAFNAPNLKLLEEPLIRWLTNVHRLSILRSSSLAPELPLPEQSALETEMVKVPMDDFIRQYEECQRRLKADPVSPRRVLVNVATLVGPGRLAAR